MSTEYALLSKPRNSSTLLWACISLFVLTAACGGRQLKSYHDPEMDFGMIETIAVLPFDNVTNDRASAARVRDVFSTMLQATAQFYVIPRGELSRALASMGARDPEAPTVDEVKKLGKMLGVDAIVTGLVREYGEARSGQARAAMIALSVQMTETQTGRIIWSASTTKGGIGFYERILGGGGEPMNIVTEDAVAELITSLFNPRGAVTEEAPGGEAGDGAETGAEGKRKKKQPLGPKLGPKKKDDSKAKAKPKAQPKPKPEDKGPIESLDDLPEDEGDFLPEEEVESGDDDDGDSEPEASAKPAAKPDRKTAAAPKAKASEPGATTNGNDDNDDNSARALALAKKLKAKSAAGKREESSGLSAKRERLSEPDKPNPARERAKPIQDALQKYRQAIQRCVQSELKAEGRASGRGVLSFSVDANGRVSNLAYREGKKERGGKLVTCLKRAAEKWRFPPATGKPYEVTVPVVIQSSRG